MSLKRVKIACSDRTRGCPRPCGAPKYVTDPSVTVGIRSPCSEMVAGMSTARQNLRPVSEESEKHKSVALYRSSSRTAGNFDAWPYMVKRKDPRVPERCP